jgi:hypothetical protein
MVRRKPRFAGILSFQELDRMSLSKVCAVFFVIRQRVHSNLCFVEGVYIVSDNGTKGTAETDIVDGVMRIEQVGI